MATLWSLVFAVWILRYHSCSAVYVGPTIGLYMRPLSLTGFDDFDLAFGRGKGPVLLCDRCLKSERAAALAKELIDADLSGDELDD